MDEFETLISLPTGKYSAKDRYTDFRRVLMGSDEGKRVLGEILSWCHMFKPSVMGSPVDPNAVLVREGERNIALRLLTTITKEPPQLRDKQEVNNG